MTIRVELLASDGTADDFAAVVDLHREVIGDGFLSSLGTEFLNELYRAIAGSRYCFILVARLGHQPVGFICGTTSTSRFYREFLFNNGLVAVRLLARRLLSPRSMWNAIETLLYPSRNRLDLPAAEILNFCVAPARQGMGLGRQLFAALEKEFRQRQIGAIRIVTGSAQLSAQHFYSSVGANLVGSTQVHRSSESKVYVYDIAEPSIV